MALQDRVQEQTNEAKNALEAYVYGLRNKLYDQLSDFVTDDFKESTSKRLEQMEVPLSLHLLCFQDDNIINSGLTVTTSRSMVALGIVFAFCRNYLD